MMRKVLILIPVLALLVVASSAFAADGPQKFGAGTTLKDAVPVAALYKTPDAYIGKTIKVDGVVSAVCDSMGCWMAISDPADPKLVVRFKVEDGKGVVFPVSAKGKKASAEGVFQKIGNDADAKEAAGEHKVADKAAQDFGNTFQVKATGAVIF